MGAWGAGNFENDTAMDWVYELEHASDTAPVVAALEAIDDDPDARDTTVCCEALAAAEIVAALRGKGPGDDDLPEEAAAYVGRVGAEPDAELLALANRAVARIFEASELRELWEENEDAFSEWEDAVGDLLDRLEPAGGRPML